MLTKNGIGNLMRKYRAVLKKCHLLNTFGSLVVAGLMLLGTTALAGAETHIPANGIVNFDDDDESGVYIVSPVTDVTVTTDTELRTIDFGGSTRILFDGTDASEAASTAVLSVTGATYTINTTTALALEARPLPPSSLMANQLNIDATDKAALLKIYSLELGSPDDLTLKGLTVTLKGNATAAAGIDAKQLILSEGTSLKTEGMAKIEAAVSFGVSATSNASISNTGNLSVRGVNTTNASAEAIVGSGTLTVAGGLFVNGTGHTITQDVLILKHGTDENGAPVTSEHSNAGNIRLTGALTIDATGNDAAPHGAQTTLANTGRINVGSMSLMGAAGSQMSGGTAVYRHDGGEFVSSGDITLKGGDALGATGGNAEIFINANGFTLDGNITLSRGTAQGAVVAGKSILSIAEGVAVTLSTADKHVYVTGGTVNLSGTSTVTLAEGGQLLINGVSKDDATLNVQKTGNLIDGTLTLTQGSIVAASDTAELSVNTLLIRADKQDVTDDSSHSTGATYSIDENVKTTVTKALIVQGGNGTHAMAASSANGEQGGNAERTAGAETLLAEGVTITVQGGSGGNADGVYSGGEGGGATLKLQGADVSAGAYVINIVAGTAAAAQGGDARLYILQDGVSAASIILNGEGAAQARLEVGDADTSTQGVTTTTKLLDISAGGFVSVNAGDTLRVETGGEFKDSASAAYIIKGTFDASAANLAPMAQATLLGAYTVQGEQGDLRLGALHIDVNDIWSDAQVSASLVDANLPRFGAGDIWLTQGSNVYADVLYLSTQSDNATLSSNGTVSADRLVVDGGTGSLIVESSGDYRLAGLSIYGDGTDAADIDAESITLNANARLELGGVAGALGNYPAHTHTVGANIIAKNMGSIVSFTGGSWALEEGKTLGLDFDKGAVLHAQNAYVDTGLSLDVNEGQFRDAFPDQLPTQGFIVSGENSTLVFDSLTIRDTATEPDTIRLAMSSYGEAGERGGEIHVKNTLTLSAGTTSRTAFYGPDHGITAGSLATSGQGVTLYTNLTLTGNTASAAIQGEEALYLRSGAHLTFDGVNKAQDTPLNIGADIVGNVGVATVTIANGSWAGRNLSLGGNSNLIVKSGAQLDMSGNDNQLNLQLGGANVNTKFIVESDATLTANAVDFLGTAPFIDTLDRFIVVGSAVRCQVELAGTLRLMGTAPSIAGASEYKLGIEQELYAKIYTALVAQGSSGKVSIEKWSFSDWDSSLSIGQVSPEAVLVNPDQDIVAGIMQPGASVTAQALTGTASSEITPLASLTLNPNNAPNITLATGEVAVAEGGTFATGQGEFSSFFNCQGEASFASGVYSFVKGLTATGSKALLQLTDTEFRNTGDVLSVRDEAIMQLIGKNRFVGSLKMEQGAKMRLTASASSILDEKIIIDTGSTVEAEAGSSMTAQAVELGSTATVHLGMPVTDTQAPIQKATMVVEGDFAGDVSSALYVGFRGSDVSLPVKASLALQGFVTAQSLILADPGFTDGVGIEGASEVHVAATSMAANATHHTPTYSLAVGRNSFGNYGMDAADAVAMFNKYAQNNGKTWSAEGVSAALFIANNGLDLSGTQSHAGVLVMDGLVTHGTASAAGHFMVDAADKQLYRTGTVTGAGRALTAGSVIFAANSALFLDTIAFKSNATAGTTSTEYAFIGNDKAVFAVDADSKIVLANVATGDIINIAKGFGTTETWADGVPTGGGEAVAANSAITTVDGYRQVVTYVDPSGIADPNNYQLQVVGCFLIIRRPPSSTPTPTPSTPASWLDPSISSMYTKLFDNNYDTQFADTNAGIAFLVNANNNDLGALTVEERSPVVARDVEGAMQASSVAGVHATTNDVVDAVSGAPAARVLRHADANKQMASVNLPLNESGLSAGNEAVDKVGLGVWLSPLYSHSSTSGFSSGNFESGYSTDLAGMAFGADITLAEVFTLGLAFNVGGGNTHSTGDFADSTNSFDFWGISGYLGYTHNSFGMLLDVGYTGIWNSITQDVSARIGMGNLEADVNSSAWTVGLRAEYRIETDFLDIIPHAGVRYTSITVDAHDINSAGGAVFNVESSHQNLWTFPIGVTFSKNIETSNDWYITPMLDLGIVVSAGDFHTSTRASIPGFADLGTSDLQMKNVDAFAFDGGAGIGISNGAFSFDVNYNIQVSSHRTNHMLFGTFRYEF